MPRSMFGEQPVSKRPTAPRVGFSTASREVREKVHYVSEEAPKQRRAVDHSIPPPKEPVATTVSMGGKQLTLWTQTQLEQTDRTALRRRAQALQEALGRENLPTLPHQINEMTRWILEAQVMLTASTGQPQTVADFGGGTAPTAEEQGELYFGSKKDKWIKNAAAAPQPSAKPTPKAPPMPASSDAVSAYMQAQGWKADNKQRNKHSNIFHE
mmetsp:Transcript_54824/g.150881  ORF Transcript_54824/g.150881 Transcript_54824/m.150881 type:complete len:212 (+) Transcript_54824:38-673(+)